MNRALQSILSWRALALVLVLAFAHPHGAQAYSCSATSPGAQSFGNVSPVSGNASSFSGTIAVTCTVAPLEGLLSGTTVRACISISGSSGSTPRTLTSGANAAQYNLYSDAAHTQVWGSVSSAPAAPVAVDFPLGLLGILLGGSATINVPLYGYMPAGQTADPAATYTQNFAGTATQINYQGYTGSAPTCSGAWASGGNFPFTVSATVINDCNINATNINFGSTGVLSASLYASGDITVQCTANDSYAIALSAGTTPGATLTNRLMLGTSGATTKYQLYTSATYTAIWGDGSSGTSTVGGVGSGGTQDYVVYAQVPVQTTPVPGSYNDTVTALITY